MIRGLKPDVLILDLKMPGKNGIDSILYSIVENEDNIKNIYLELAKQRGENVHTIKSDINTAINNMWRFTDRKNTRRILRIGEADKPSSKCIISMVRYYVEN